MFNELQLKNTGLHLVPNKKCRRMNIFFFQFTVGPQALARTGNPDGRARRGEFLRAANAKLRPLVRTEFG